MRTGRATLIGDVPIGTGDTFYVRYGDWSAWLAVAVMLGFLVHGGALRMRGRRRD